MPNLLGRHRCHALGLPLTVERYDPARAPWSPHRAGTVKVLHVPLVHPVTAGELDVRNAAYVIQMLDRACDGCMSGEFAAMVTAPVQKSVLMDAGYTFSGHTEYLANRTGAELPVMLLLSDDTSRWHWSLPTCQSGRRAAKLSRASALLLSTLRIVHRRLWYAIFVCQIRASPYLDSTLTPARVGTSAERRSTPLRRSFDELIQDGMNIEGPVPADTAFTPRFLQNVPMSSSPCITIKAFL